MSYAAINDVINLFYQVLGNGFIMALFVIAFFMIIMFIMRAPMGAILIVLLPIILSFTISNRASSFIEFPPYIFYVLLLVVGFALATVIILSWKN